jgi:hypothetical protein
MEGIWSVHLLTSLTGSDAVVLRQILSSLGNQLNKQAKEIEELKKQLGSMK